MAIERSASAPPFRSIRRLSDDELAAKLDLLSHQKHAIDAEMLLCLSEIERRRLYREQACSSLFEFCVARLGQSEDVAYKRVGAARLMLQFPSIYELLVQGRIHLTGLMLLKPLLTEANHHDWLAVASGKSKRQIEKLIATRHPLPDVPSSIRKLPKSKAQDVISRELSCEAKTESAPLRYLEQSDTLAPSAPSTVDMSQAEVTHNPD